MTSFYLLPAPFPSFFIRSVSSASIDTLINCFSYRTTSRNVYLQQCLGGLVVLVSKLRDGVQQFFSLSSLDAHGSEVDHRPRLLQSPIQPLVFALDFVVLVVSLPIALGKGIGAVTADRHILPGVYAIGQFLEQRFIFQLDLQTFVYIELPRGGHFGGGKAGVEGRLDVDETVFVLQPVLAHLLHSHQPADCHF